MTKIIVLLLDRSPHISADRNERIQKEVQSVFHQTNRRKIFSRIWDMTNYGFWIKSISISEPKEAKAKRLKTAEGKSS